MDKELQDLTWSVLSKEFKKEVKNKWGDTDCGSFAEELLESIFGLGNLISDADGEEMLTVPRSVIIDRYHALTHPEDEYDSPHRRANIFLLQQLFGSKCLPDNVDSSRNNVDSLELKQSRCEKCGATNSSICAHMNCQDYQPYTEPTDAASSNVNHSDIDIDELVAKGCVPDPVKHFDNILKRGFRDHNRLHIAAMAMQGLLANAAWTERKLSLALEAAGNNETAAVDILTKEIAEDAVEFADALIAKCEEGENHVLSRYNQQAENAKDVNR